jgi:hypothetical protein
MKVTLMMTERSLWRGHLSGWQWEWLAFAAFNTALMRVGPQLRTPLGFWPRGAFCLLIVAPVDVGVGWWVGRILHTRRWSLWVSLVIVAGIALIVWCLELWELLVLPAAGE